MSESTNLPATTQAAPPVPMKVGGQELTIPAQATELYLKRTGGEWDVQEIATMGRSPAFIRRDEKSGVLLLVRKNVVLSEAKKEVVNLKGTYIITVPGYNRLNQIAGLHIITPPSITVNGTEQANPAVIYSPKGEIKRVIARKIAIGYSPTGNLVAIDTVRHYNFDAYYLQDLHAKTGQADAARYGTSVLCPFAEDAEIAKEGTMTYARKGSKVYVFKPIMDMEGIWIDPSHSEIKEVYKQHIQHQKFGDVTSQNMASRNALKMHPAIAAAQVLMNKGEATVEVFGYRSPLTKAEYDKIGESIVKGEQPEGVDIQRDEAEASYEEIVVAAETESVDGTEAPSDASAPTREPGDEPEENIMAAIESVAKAKGVVSTDEFCKNMFNKAKKDLTEEEQHRFLAALEKMKTPKKAG